MVTRIILTITAICLFAVFSHCSEGNYSNDASVIGLDKEAILKKFGHPVSWEASPFEADPDDKLADALYYEWWRYTDKVIYFNRHGKVLELKNLK